MNKVSKLISVMLKRNTLNDSSLERLENLFSSLEEEVMPESDGRARVVRTQVRDHLLHLVPWQERDWCTSKDIAQLVHDWRGWDLVDKMMVTRNMDMEKAVLKKDMDTNLWQEMEKLEVGGVDKDEVSFYLLQDIPSIVRAFARPETWGGCVDRLEEILGASGKRGQGWEQ